MGGNGCEERDKGRYQMADRARNALAKA